MIASAANPAHKNRGKTSHSVFTGDCCDFLRSVEPGTVDLVIADPPYNIGIDYGRGKSADRRKDYAQWCDSWIQLCARALKKTGSLWIISGQEHFAEIDLGARGAGFTVRNRVTWHETFGVYCHNKFGRCSRPMLYAVRDPKRFTFNKSAVTIPSARQEKYNDRRAAAGGKIMGDVWQINRVCGTFKERVRGVPTQLPKELVRRIIGVSSNPGDLVLDPFLGSGTSLIVAKEMGRSGVGSEMSDQYSAIAQEAIRKARYLDG